ncbi:MAG TPA: PIN domain-containing protein [Vicinamibacterales bacterium]|nr:PIN domain-containing protein [Vicinamibacterales bacterium]
MAWFLLARVLFLAAVTGAAIFLRPLDMPVMFNAGFGLLLGILVVVFEWRMRDLSVTHMLGAVLGAALGLALARMLVAALFWTDTAEPRMAFLHALVVLVLTYLGVLIGGRRGEWLEPARLVTLFRAAGPQRRYKILDTSVIIDGRIADICETGFIDGTLLIPQFVLKELQLVADSADSLKRNRGRRGLDILQKIQKMSGIEVMISDLDYPEVREVDLKLIELARTLQGKIVTNDFNLNKVAQLRGVDVLNINELANSLKPVVLPGEIMKVFILKEGKEYNQGVAYLDDGTMVVVDNARKMISKTIDVVVTSVLQTTAGKMIFGRFIDPNLAAAQAAAQSGDRDDQGAPPRRPRPVPVPPAVTVPAGVPPAAVGSGAPVPVGAPTPPGSAAPAAGGVVPTSGTGGGQ